MAARVTLIGTNSHPRRIARIMKLFRDNTLTNKTIHRLKQPLRMTRLIRKNKINFTTQILAILTNRLRDLRRHTGQLRCRELIRISRMTVTAHTSKKAWREMDTTSKVLHHLREAKHREAHHKESHRGEANNREAHHKESHQREHHQPGI